MGRRVHNFSAGPSTLPLEVPSSAHEEDLLRRAGEAGLVNLKGHRSVGGCRASLYNALPEAAARALAEFLTEFRSGRG